MKDTHEIKLLISDFDGTLVDTEQANYYAYRTALKEEGISLTPEFYHLCFGLRLMDFMERVGVSDSHVIQRVKERKADCYPDFFSELRLNKSVLSFVRYFRQCGKPVAIATTAHKKNLLSVLDYFKITNEFDSWITCEDIKQGKPDPECYLKVMAHYNTPATNTLIFEDSIFGVQAAKNSGANYIVVNK